MTMHTKHVCLQSNGITSFSAPFSTLMLQRPATCQADNFASKNFTFLHTHNTHVRTCSTLLGLDVYSAQMNNRSANGIARANAKYVRKSFCSQPQKLVTLLEESFFMKLLNKIGIKFLTLFDTADAMHNVGSTYLCGLPGVEKDETLGFEYLLKAAGAGHTNANTLVGACYLSGTGVAQNETLGFEYSLKAAEAGCNYSMHHLGMIYENQKNMPKALEWYTKAAAKGNSSAQKDLEGISIHPSLWYNISRNISITHHFVA